MSDIFNSLQSVLPGDTTPVVLASVRAVEELPELGDWHPDVSSLFGAMTIVSTGFPLSFLVGNKTFDRLRSAIGTAISKNGAPNPDDLSEVNAVALAVALGATGAENVKRDKGRTPDFLVGWNDEVIEMEVTRAAQKQAFVERQRFSHNIAGRLHALHYPFDLNVHITNVLDADEEASLFEAAKAITLSAPATFESIGKWSISAEPIMRLPNVLITGGQRDTAPDWWPEGTVTSYVFTQTVDTREATVASPQIRVNFGVPVASYINPVEHKAARLQGSGELPFVVAIDVNQLPGAFGEFRRVLPGYFSLWPHLSGVLVFTNIFMMPFEQIGWIMELIVNPHAKNPLPLVVLEKMQVQIGKIEVWSNLRLSQQESS